MPRRTPEESEIRNKIMQRKWREKHREELREYSKKYYIEKKERFYEYNKIWRRSHRERISGYNRAYYLKRKLAAEALNPPEPIPAPDPFADNQGPQA
jgi:hypothetical protein